MEKQNTITLTNVSVECKKMKFKLTSLYDYHLLFFILTSVVWFIPTCILIIILFTLLSPLEKKNGKEHSFPF